MAVGWVKTCKYAPFEHFCLEKVSGKFLFRGFLANGEMPDFVPERDSAGQKLDGRIRSYMPIWKIKKA